MFIIYIYIFSPIPAIIFKWFISIIFYIVWPASKLSAYFNNRLCQHWSQALLGSWKVLFIKMSPSLRTFLCFPKRNILDIATGRQIYTLIQFHFLKTIKNHPTIFFKQSCNSLQFYVFSALFTKLRRKASLNVVEFSSLEVKVVTWNMTF